MGKSARKTDIGESAPGSNIGRAQVRKGGVWKYTLPCIWTACATFLDVTCMVATT